MKTITFVCPITKKRKQIALPEEERHALITPVEPILHPVGWGRIVIEIATVNPAVEQARITHQAAMNEARAKLAEDPNTNATDAEAILSSLQARLDAEVPLPEHEVVWSRTELDPLSDEALALALDTLKKGGFDV